MSFDQCRLVLAAVSEKVAPPREAADDFGEQQWRSIAILDVGGVDEGMDQIGLGIGEDMAFAPLDLLARVPVLRRGRLRRADRRFPSF